METLVEEMRGLSLRLQDETKRQLERLQAAAGGETPAHAADAGRLASLEQELQAAREETARAARLAEQLGERLNGREAAEQSLVAGVPGTGFGRPGHFRLAYCTRRQVIERALPGFRRVLSKC